MWCQKKKSNRTKDVDGIYHEKAAQETFFSGKSTSRNHQHGLHNWRNPVDLPAVADCGTRRVGVQQDRWKRPVSLSVAIGDAVHNSHVTNLYSLFVDHYYHFFICYRIHRNSNVDCVRLVSPIN